MSYTIEPFIKEYEIYHAIEKLADQITQYYGTKPIVVIGLLKGSFMLVADLIRHLSMPIQVEFMSISSYGNGTESGEIKIELDLRNSIKDKHVLLVEDIIDTGNSLYKVLKLLESKNPKSLDIAVLVSKPTKLENDVNVRFTGFSIDDHFIVGYGMDYGEKHRELPYIGKVMF